VVFTGEFVSQDGRQSIGQTLSHVGKVGRLDTHLLVTLSNLFADFRHELAIWTQELEEGVHVGNNHVTVFRRGFFLRCRVQDEEPLQKKVSKLGVGGDSAGFLPSVQDTGDTLVAKVHHCMRLKLGGIRGLLALRLMARRDYERLTTGSNSECSRDGSARDVAENLLEQEGPNQYCKWVVLGMHSVSEGLACDPQNDT
jgi:hypothetical protein